MGGNDTQPPASINELFVSKATVGRSTPGPKVPGEADRPLRGANLKSFQVISVLPRGATRSGLPPYLFAGRIVVVDGLEPENGIRTIGHHVDGSVRSAVDIPDSAGVFENDFDV